MFVFVFLFVFVLVCCWEWSSFVFLPERSCGFRDDSAIGRSSKALTKPSEKPHEYSWRKCVSSNRMKIPPGGEMSHYLCFVWWDGLSYTVGWYSLYNTTRGMNN